MRKEQLGIARGAVIALIAGLVGTNLVYAAVTFANRWDPTLYARLFSNSGFYEASWVLVTALIVACCVVIGVRMAGFAIGVVEAAVVALVTQGIMLVPLFLLNRALPQGEFPLPEITSAFLGPPLLFVSVLIQGYFINTFAQPRRTSESERWVETAAPTADLLELVLRERGRPDHVMLGRPVIEPDGALIVNRRRWFIEGEERPQHPTAVARYVLRLAAPVE